MRGPGSVAGPFSSFRLYSVTGNRLHIMIGEAFGGQARVRKYLEKANGDLRDQLQQARPNTPNLQRELTQQRRILNDLNKRIITVTKGSKKGPRDRRLQIPRLR
jgi:hypothetical protein